MRKDVRRALQEDIGTGDLSAALVPEGQSAIATVLLRDSAVVCGQPWFDEVFRQLSKEIEITWYVAEGDGIAGGTRLCQLTGPARPLLSGERTALNFLQTLSATATSAREFSAAVEGTEAVILDTRKTIPGLRLAQKYAVKTGGACNHRIGLFDAVMIKENHIAACGGIESAVATAREKFGTVKVIVEVETLAEAETALATPIDQILLDDFNLTDIATAVELRNQRAPNVRLEASGNMTMQDIREVAGAGVDYISVGSLTKHVRAVDLSMRFEFSEST
jgi:nicotinate-nucleotide pyrophosphorylase (carboxylating)